MWFLKEGILNFGKALYLLSDELIMCFHSSTFCVLFNLRSVFMRWDIRFKYSTEQKIYEATSSNLRQKFLNRRQALNAYRVSLRRRSQYMKSVYQLEKVELKNGDVVVDCGANVGDLLLYFKTLNIKAHYIGFEPSPSEFRCLMQNAPDSDLHNFGLWNEDSSLNFYVSSDGADSSFIMPKRYDEIIKISTKRLDEIISPHLMIKLLKLEAEGAEPEAIKGAENILQNIEYISADLGFERGVSEESTLAPVVNFLLERGFELVNVTSGRVVALFHNKIFIKK